MRIEYYVCDRCGARISQENTLLVELDGQQLPKAADCCPECQSELREIIAAYFRRECIVVQKFEEHAISEEHIYQVVTSFDDD